jgi:hypothetical protein
MFFKASDVEYFSQELACMATRVTNLTISFDDSKLSNTDAENFFVNALGLFTSLNYLNLNLR